MKYRLFLLVIFLITGMAVLSYPDRSDNGNISEEVKKEPGITKQKTVDLGDGVKMEFVFIPAGEFVMGSQEMEERLIDNEKQHKVILTKGFYMQTTEVTQAQWKAVMRSNPSNFKGDNLPVENVSWNDAQEFIKKLNEKEKTKVFRLPTEAEWEYACRAGSKTAYYWGDEMDGDYCWYMENSDDKTHPVGTKKPNAWGLYDMSGSVWEWCSDSYDEYPSGEVKDPKGPEEGIGRLLRGGSWGDPPMVCRSAFRFVCDPDDAGDIFGFRLVRAHE